MVRLREIKPGMVIHCKTREEANILCDAVGASSFCKEWWDSFQGKTCYKVCAKGVSCYELPEHFEKDYMFEFSDLIIPELSAEEVLRVYKEICSGRDCGVCPLGENCFMSETMDYKKVVEICEQWKVDHEKKEPEFEWVDICRIIEIQSNGFKKCVHEQEMDSGISPENKELVAADILRRYISSHDGNYIAVVERVCRLKK